jgi:DNA replication protein DnaC
VQNVIWIGPTGTGKTGLATAYLSKAINEGHSGL